MNPVTVPVWNPFRTLLRREIARFMKVIYQTVFTPLITATLYLLIFGVSLGGNIELASGLPYLSFLIPGLVMMSVLNNAFQNAASSIVSGKFSGDLEDLRVVPVSAVQILWAMSLGGLFRGVAVGFITFLVGEVFYFAIYGSFLAIESPILLFVFLLLGGLSFAQMGIAVAFWAKTFDQMSAVGAFVLVPLIYLGGVFFSLDGLHGFWRTLSLFNPLLYFINGVRFSILGESDVPVGTALLVSFLGLMFFQTIALYTLKRGEYTRW